MRINTSIKVFVFFALIGLPVLSQAQLAGEEKLTPTSGMGMTLMLYLLVFTLIGGVYFFFFKKGSRWAGFSKKNSQLIEFLSVKPLGGRQNLIATKVGSKNVLLSSGPQGVNFLCEFELEPDAFSKALDQEEMS